MALVLDSFMPISRSEIGRVLSHFVTALRSTSVVVDDIILTEFFPRLQCLALGEWITECKSFFVHKSDEAAEEVILKWHDRRKVLGFGVDVDAKWEGREARGEVSRKRVTIMSHTASRS